VTYRGPTILEALADPNLLGCLPTFHDLSGWRRWLVFLGAMYGLPLDAEGVEIFRQHTGRSSYAPPPGGWPEVVCIVGRQAGKSRIASTVAAYEAAIVGGTPGEFALVIAQDHRGAMRTLLRYAREPFEAVPLLREEIAGETADSLMLTTGITIASYPCRPQAVRGLRARFAAVDELAFFVSSEGRAVDLEMLRAVRPALATTRGRLLILSSPYGQSGALWDLHRRHFGRDDSPVLVWQASAADMNPTLPADYLERMREEDPEAYQSEVLGEFRAGLASLFDSEALDRVVMPGRRELGRVDDVHYQAFVDPSGGRSDAFTLAIGHLESRRAIVDAVRAWPAPCNPTAAVAEAKLALQAYGVGTVTGDRFAGEWPREAFRSHGISYLVAEQPKSDLYLELLAAVNSERVELLDLPPLLRELRGLERRRGSSGRDRVDHRPGSHDDVANAVAGLVVRLVGRPEVNLADYGWFC